MLEYEKYKLKIRQALPLEDKIRLTNKRISQWIDYFGSENIYISFSGGKDSTVLLDLVHKIDGSIPAVFIDTGLEYPEIRAFAKEKNAIFIRPEISFQEVIKKFGYPVISKEVSQFISDYRKKPNGYTAQKFDSQSDYIKRYGSRYDISKWIFLRDSDIKISSYCCNAMKKNPIKKYEKKTGKKPFLGTMACESNLRKNHYLKSGCNAFDNKRPVSNPLGFWTEQDILEYIYKFNISYASVYGEIIKGNNGIYSTTGCDRTGCIFCMFGCHLDKSPNRFQKLAITHPKQWDFCINELGIKNVLDFIGVKYTPESKLQLGLFDNERINK